MTDAPKPRIALLLSGLPRQWKPSLTTQLMIFKDYHLDVFFHFWDTIDDAEKNEILALLKPRAYRFEKPQDFSHANTDPRIQRDLINVPSNLFSQYYSWRGALSVFEPYKAEYQFAARSRADLQFVYPINHIIPMLKPDNILIPVEQNNVLTDFFAIGGVEPIIHYHTLYDHLYEHAPKGEFNPENLLTRHFMLRNDFHILADQSRYFFVRRPHMTNYTIEQAMAETPGRNKWLNPEQVKLYKDFHTQVAGEKGAAHVDAFSQAQLAEMAKELNKSK